MLMRKGDVLFMNMHQNPPFWLHIAHGHVEIIIRSYIALYKIYNNFSSTKGGLVVERGI